MAGDEEKNRTASKNSARRRKRCAKPVSHTEVERWAGPHGLDFPTQRLEMPGSHAQLAKRDLVFIYLLRKLLFFAYS